MSTSPEMFKKFAACVTSLSPLPEKFNTTLHLSGNVGHNFSKYAKACDVSNAGMIPSNLDVNTNASSAS